METIDTLYKEWLSLQPMKDADKKRLEQKFMLEFNYNSSHIEGNTLTYGQTKLLLLFGQVVDAANMRDLEEMKAHNVVRPEAAAKGYVVDNLVTPNDVPAGRPAPYMIYKNMIDLAIPSVDCVVKVGDTIADIKEGLNAKVWSIGIVTGSNEMGLSEEEYKHRSAEELSELKREVREKMLNAGAHFVLDNITELPACIEKINR